jgi:hypothetical protein
MTTKESVFEEYALCGAALHPPQAGTVCATTGWSMVQKRRKVKKFQRVLT